VAEHNRNYKQNQPYSHGIPRYLPRCPECDMGENVPQYPISAEPLTGEPRVADRQHERIMLTRN
jgi:hypothetical protein